MTPTTIAPSQAAVHFKGAGFDAAVEYAEELLGPQRAAELLRRVEGRVGPLAPYRLASARVPLDVAGRLFSEIAEASGTTFEQRRAVMEKLGAFIAQRNLSGVFKALISLVGSPERLVRRVPSLWATYFPNTVTEMDLSELASHRSICVTTGLEGVPYINAMAAGWFVYALELVGAKTGEVEEEGLTRRSFDPRKPLRFDIRWS